METLNQLKISEMDKEPTIKESFNNNNFIHHKELSDELSNENIFQLLSNITIYNIIFQNKTKNGENKMILLNKSILKILKMANIEEEDIFSFISFYHNEINLEAIDENKDIYNINYNNLMTIINYVHISHNDNDIKIHKSSLKKIIDLCGLIRDEKLKYMNFQDIKDNKEGEFDNKISINSNENNLNTINYNEERNRIIHPKKILRNNNQNSNTIETHQINIDNLLSNEDLNDSNKNILLNKRYNNNIKNFLLDSDEEDYENKLLQRSYNILRAKKKNSIVQLNNIYNDTKDDAYFNTLDTLNNENTLSTSLNDYNNHYIKISNPKPKEKIKKITKKKKKFRRYNTQTLYKISSTSSITYLGSTTSLKGLIKEKENESNLIYPYNGYTQISTSISIEAQNKQKEILTKKLDEDYCFYPFIIRRTSDIKNKDLYLSGSIPKLGAWDPLRAIKIDLEERNREKYFTKYIEVYKKEMPFEYKYFYYDDNNKIKWLGDPFQNYIAFKQFFNYLRLLKKSHISIMNINIRYINKIDGINIWENRKNKLIELLLNKTADIFFFQEITRPQSKFINKYLSSIYEFVGEYRDSTKTSEKCSICVNKLKYTIIHSGQFWLSSTPNIPGSNDFGNFFPRTCTWASFKQIGGITLLFMNVHLDHANKRAHLPCIRVLLDEEEIIEKKFIDIKFVFIGGCFYCEERDEEINYIKKRGYNEIKFENTYHGFSGNAKNHWDYMFWKEKSGEDIELKDVYVLKKEATIDKSKNYYISDHYPVYAEFYHKNKK